jgi:hypothetical protein
MSFRRMHPSSPPGRNGVHETVMTLLSSNWAAVATTDAWIDAVQAGATLPRSNLAESAMAGRSVL